MTVRLPLGILCAFAFALPVHAASIQWTLNNVTLSDGGTASGSFFFDADTNIYSGVAVVTTSGSSASGASYVAPLFAPGQPPFFVPVVIGFGTSSDLNVGGRAFAIAFNSPLTNAGGIRTLLTSGTAGEVQCTINQVPNYGCTLTTGTGTLLRTVTGGTVSAAVVPVPGAVWLLGGALGLLGVVRRRAR